MNVADKLIEAAQSARDTLDSIRRGARFSPAMIEAVYERLRISLLPFDPIEEDDHED